MWDGWHSYFNKWKLKILAQLGGGGGVFQPGHCAIGILPDQVLLAVVQDPTVAGIDLLVSHPLKYTGDLARVLKKTVVNLGLEGMSCSWILYPDQYQLFLMDNLPVESSEFQSAIRWKLMELLAFPVEEAVIDSFPVPPQKTHDPHSMIMVGVARTELLQKGALALSETGLNLVGIGIQELALRNIATLLEPEERSVALVYLEENRSEVLIARFGLLYLQRGFTLGWGRLGGIQNVEPDQNVLEQLALELQRSFDYYQSQWRYSPPSQIFLATSSSASDAGRIAAGLASRLAVNVVPLSLETVLPVRQASESGQMDHSLPVMGGIVRRERITHAAGH